MRKVENDPSIRRENPLTTDPLPVAQRLFDTNGKLTGYSVTVTRKNNRGKPIIREIIRGLPFQVDGLIEMAGAESEDNFFQILGAGVNAYYQRMPLDEFMNPGMYLSPVISINAVIKHGKEQLRQGAEETSGE